VLGLFALASAVIVAVSRLEQLRALPSQTFAERYLMWPSLFWMSLALLLLNDLRVHRVAVRAGALFAAGLIPVVLYPTHSAWADWGAIIYRSAQQSAASARSGVIDDAVFPDGPDAAAADVRMSLALLRDNQLAMFTDDTYRLLGTRVAGPLARDNAISVQASITRTVKNRESDEPAARIEGVVAEGINRIRRQGTLAIVDADDVIVGFAELSALGHGHSLRITMPPKRGFDGYIRSYRTGNVYRLVLLRKQTRDAVLLATMGS
jgi:hypothetical protein